MNAFRGVIDMSSHVLELGVKVAQGVTITAKHVRRWTLRRWIATAGAIVVGLVLAELFFRAI